MVALLLLLLLLGLLSLLHGKLLLNLVSDDGLLANHHDARHAGRKSLLRQWDWWRFVFHAGILQLVRPFTTGTSMTVLQVLTEVVCPEKLLALVAFTKLVYMV